MMMPSLASKPSISTEGGVPRVSPRRLAPPPPAPPPRPAPPRRSARRGKHRWRSFVWLCWAYPPPARAPGPPQHHT